MHSTHMNVSVGCGVLSPVLLCAECKGIGWENPLRVLNANLACTQVTDMLDSAQSNSPRRSRKSGTVVDMRFTIQLLSEQFYGER